MLEMQMWSLGQEDIATSSSILAWKIPWTEEFGGLQPMGLKRVRHNSATTHSCLTMLWPYQVASKVTRPYIHPFSRKQPSHPAVDRAGLPALYSRALFAIHFIFLNVTQPWKEWNSAICSNVDRSRDYHTKWSKPERDRYNMTSLTCGI